MPPEIAKGDSFAGGIMSRPYEQGITRNKRNLHFVFISAIMNIEF